jgi:hypothetical protein
MPGNPTPADAAAAADAISVIRHRQQPYGVTVTKTTTDLPQALPDGYCWPPDPIELPCCVQEWNATGWRHERSCAARTART